MCSLNWNGSTYLYNMESRDSHSNAEGQVGSFRVGGFATNGGLAGTDAGEADARRCKPISLTSKFSKTGTDVPFFCFCKIFLRKGIQ